MIYGLMIAFVPLFLGYLFRVSKAHLLTWNNRLINYCLYLILLTMGIAIGQLDDLATTLPQIGEVAFGMSAILHLCNISFLMIYDKMYPMKRPINSDNRLISRWKSLLSSLILCVIVFAGGLFGYLVKGIFNFPLHSSTYILVVMIFCVGVQLRNSGIPIRDVFFNKRGIVVSFIFMASGLLGGVIASFLLDLPLVRSIAIASGFGWYSLSSVLLNEAWGAVYGSIAFFNDLSREILCLFTIPFFMQRFPATAVSFGGATALDCTLPIIQKAGGIHIVPFAISFGFIINLAVPVLLAFFIGLA